MTEINRRELVVRGGGAIGGLSLLGLLAACNDESDAGSSAGPQTRGGTLRFSQAGRPPGFDPQKWWNAQAAIVATACCEVLVAIDNYSGKRVPQLAVAEPVASDGGRVYTYKLRPGVKFHGGNGTMTADDVKFSWERLLSPDLAAEAGFIYASVPIEGLKRFQDGKAKEVTGFRVVDELTFEVVLENADSAFLPAFTYTHAVVLPRSYYEGKKLEQVNWAPIGTGPFVLDEVEKASGAKLVRNRAYWNRKVPYVQAVDMSYNVEPALAVQRIQKGQQDLMLEPIPAPQLNQLRNDPTTKDLVKEAGQNDCQWLSLPTKLKPFNDIRVRQAVAMAIDKEKLAKVVKGTGDPATGGVFSPKSRYFEKGLAYPYDPDKAKALLAEAGLGDGFEAPFWYQNQPPYSDMGPAIIQDLAQVGIRAKGSAKIYDQFVQETNPGPEAMIIFAWEDAFGHGSYLADSAFTSAAIEGGCCNYAKFSSPKLDALAQQGHDPDEQTSDDAYRQISRIVVKDEALWVPLLYPTRADLIGKSVRGFETAVYPSGQSKPFGRYSLAS